jgi:hypothetical protein
VSLPVDLRLALSPLDTYRELVGETVPASWSRALERPVMVAVIIGTAVTMCSAERAPAGLLLMGVACWSFVPVLQLLIGMIVIAIARPRSMRMARAIELLFVAQLPWSLWVLAMTGAYRFLEVNPGLVIQVSGLAVPALWTLGILWAFCRTVLDCSPRRALIMLVVHQALTWTVFFGYVTLVSGVWPRLLAAIGR